MESLEIRGLIQERHGEMDHGLTRDCRLQRLFVLLCALHTLTLGETFDLENFLTVNGVLDQSVELKCGDIDASFFFIWTFIILGTDHPIPIAGNDNVYKDASALGIVTLNGSSMVIDKLQLRAQGRYACTAFKPGTDSAPTVYIDLTVLVPVLQPNIQINDQTPVEGTRVAMLCTVKVGTGPISFIWQRHTKLGDTFTLREGNNSFLLLDPVTRAHAGWYTCTVRNMVNEETSGRYYLDVIYGPDEPEISIKPYAISENGYAANELEEVTLNCSAPSNPPCHYTWLYNNSKTFTGQIYVIPKISRTQTGMYTCWAENSYLKAATQSTIILTVYLMPPGGPNCSAVATKMNEFIMLTCEWTGGLPRITLQWNNSQIGDVKESSNIYVFKPDRMYDGRLFICTALHPMAEPAQCYIKLMAPVLDSPNLETSILEGKSPQLICNLKLATPSSEITWYDNSNKEIITDSQKYGIYKQNGISVLTVRETVSETDSGLYRCMASNAVGNTSLLLRLRVNKYPTPPNVTISKLLYSRQRTEVDLEWMTKGVGDLTGFMVQRQASIRSAPIPKRSVQDAAWDTVASDIEPEIRGHKLAGLDPSIVYAFRILAVNHKTTGFPSEVKTPADPPNNVYPVAIGAGFAGMLVASVACLLVFQYVVRNRENNPRLHDLFFRPASAEARENIRTPEDAETAADGSEEPSGSGEPAPAAESPAEVSATAAAPSNTEEVPLPELSPSPEDAPVNVTITVTAQP
ncbi:V-set and immunoglobulin domain-containing protein 10-like 2 isoform X2 [Hyla sarda]|uniref:V-set and immunoglobulin domain-containing protein 10-like 2 isoform X2 n=1 Tax=Hyla sarda TaxID=327740 RepID=UPI0024C44852|nr:V-set and immunoglobulin domain-containing protein 10-like 2 isoform X2 [Hyla sarda]